MMRFISLLLRGMCVCVVSVVMWSSLVCQGGCLGTLCYGCGGCVGCDACSLVCVLGEYAERVRWCEGNGNDGVEAGGGVGAVSAGCEHMGGTRGSEVVFVQTTFLL